MEKQSTQILSIEGKDILLSRSNYIVTKAKKFKATLDYSLDTIKLDEIAKEVSKKDIFYMDKGKQKTNAIINLTFEYAVKEYQKRSRNNENVYVLYTYNFTSDELKKLSFVNGFYIKGKEIVAIEINKSNRIVENEFLESLRNGRTKLPKGITFKIKDSKITIIVDKNKIKPITSIDEIREQLYKDGFNITEEGKRRKIAYVRYKRSSGSSREGKCLFIRKDLYKRMMEWSYMGLSLDGEIDLAAMEAYISLTTSSIIDTIDIDPKSILIIDDYESNFTNAVMETTIVNGELVTKLNKEAKISNKIWDGQSLLASDLFKDKYGDKGFLLLRNQFFKSACFQCNIQQFFKDNGITDIKQLNGKTLATKIEDIKMITTKSSIKYLKFNNDFEQYINKISSTFGIVKYEKPTRYFDGDMVQAHYQLLNTLQLSVEEVKELLKPSLDYVNLLKNDIRVFREYIHVNIGDESDMDMTADSNALMMEMLKLNPAFEKTDLFFNFRSDAIDSYVKNLRKGHILIPGTNAVLCGNGYEMLQATINKDAESNEVAKTNVFTGESILKTDEIWCDSFKDGEELLCCRSPHITMGGLWIPKNVKNDLIDKYFKNSKNIVHINSIGTNVLQKLSGADFDSDQIMITNSKLAVAAAKKNYDDFLVPTFNSENKPKTKTRYNTAEEKADLDIKTSKNLIGDITNVSQILNSKLWNVFNVKTTKGDGFDLLKKMDIENLYKDISTLSVLASLEIDKAKKEISISSKEELKKIKDKWCADTHISDTGMILDRRLTKITPKEYLEKNKGEKLNAYSAKPNFFKYLAKRGAKPKYLALAHSTTMEFIQMVISDKMPNIKSDPRKGTNAIATLASIFNEDVSITNTKTNRGQAEIIRIECTDLNEKIKVNWMDERIEGEERFKRNCELKTEFIDRLKALAIHAETIKHILYNLDKDYTKLREITNLNKRKAEKDKIKFESLYTPIGRLLVTCLYESHKTEFLNVFKEGNQGDYEYIERKNDSHADWLPVIKLYNIDYVVRKFTL